MTVDRAWMDAAHHYSSLSESARAQYWAGLTTEQQSLLTTALSSMDATPTVTPQPKQRRGLGGTLAIGCFGMILGSALTIAIEVAAVSAGIDAMRGFLTPSRGHVPAATATMSPQDLSHADCGQFLQSNPDLYNECMLVQKLERERDEQMLRSAGSD
jgi:hypothetical protein